MNKKLKRLNELNERDSGNAELIIRNQQLNKVVNKLRKRRKNESRCHPICLYDVIFLKIRHCLDV